LTHFCITHKTVSEMAALKLKIKKTLLKRKVDGVTFGM